MAIITHEHDGNSGKIPEYNGPQHIVGHFIEVEHER